jgi:serine/threonine-protein kinase
MDGKNPKIADFGLARSSRSKPVTRSIDVKGSPTYMSPEHFMDFRRADKKSDIYSLGKILFEAIEGKVSSETIPMKRASLSKTQTLFFQKLDQIIQEATAEHREERLESAEKFRDALLEAIASSNSKLALEISRFSGRFSAFGHRKRIWASIIAVAIILAVSLMAFNFNHLRAERSEHQRPAPILNNSQMSGSMPLQSPPSITPGMQPPFPNGSVSPERSWYGYDNCEVVPGQRQW